MANKTALVFSDREWVDREIERLVLQLDSRQNGHGVKTLVAQAFVSMLLNLEAAGDKQAERVFRALAEDGASERVKVRLAAPKCLIGHNGAIVAVPQRIGVPSRDGDGVRQRNYQQRLWWECSWAQFADWLAQREANFAQQREVIGTMRRVADLQQRFPDTQTPGEACERAGIDPRDFALDEAI